MRSEALFQAFFQDFAGERGAFDEADLSAVLETALVDARAPWPGLTIPDDTFLRYLGGRIEPGVFDPKAAITALHLSDLYLACGCVLGLPKATAAFAERYLADVPKFVSRLNLQPAVVDEVQQELGQKLLVAAPLEQPRILSYNGRGALASFVAISAQRTALNLIARRSQQAQAPRNNEPLERLLMTSADPELMLAKAHLRKDLETALRGAIAQLSARDRTLLRLSVVGGLSCRKLAEMYGVNFATVSRWLVSLREALLKNVQGFFEREHGIDSEELTSVLGLARSQIELSLSGVFRADERG